MTTLTTKTAKRVSSMPWFCVLWSAAEVGLVWWAVTTEATGPSNIVKLMAVSNTIGGIILAYAAATEEKKDPRPTWLKRFLNVADFGLVGRRVNSRERVQASPQASLQEPAGFAAARE